MSYELHYWPGIQGRGEFVRLALEAAGAPYADVARTDGTGAMQHYLADASVTRPPFACPFLVHGQRVIGQTAAILLYLGPRLGLVGKSESDQVWTHQIQLTVSDFVVEVHDTHHPIGNSLYYEDQKPEAAAPRRGFPQAPAAEVREVVRDGAAAQSAQREPQHPHLVGARWSYADLSLFQVVEGLRYAFPLATRKSDEAGARGRRRPCGRREAQTRRSLPGQRAAPAVQRRRHLPALPRARRVRERTPCAPLGKSPKGACVFA